MSGLVVLLTDFGLSEYVGVMKGIIATHAPMARVIDLTHDVSPQAVREGAWLLEQSYRWFPEGSVFCCVVDPGVGTERAAVAAETERYRFVGPDNGLLYPAVMKDRLVKAVSLPVPGGASRTFHGRDVFAPAAAALANGRSLDELGEPLDGLTPLVFHRTEREGEIVRIDRFGNCITNLPPRPGRIEYTVQIEGAPAPMRLRLYRTYQEAPAGEPFLIENSYGTVEIAWRNGDAARNLGAAAGMRVRFD